MCILHNYKRIYYYALNCQHKFVYYYLMAYSHIVKEFLLKSYLDKFLCKYLSKMKKKFL